MYPPPNTRTGLTIDELSHGDPALFQPVIGNPLNADPFLVLADY